MAAFAIFRARDDQGKNKKPGKKPGQWRPQVSKTYDLAVILDDKS
jgi:hypothetical protein